MNQKYDVEISGVVYNGTDATAVAVSSKDAVSWAVYQRDESGLMVWQEEFSELPLARAYAKAISEQGVWERTA